MDKEQDNLNVEPLLPSVQRDASRDNAAFASSSILHFLILLLLLVYHPGINHIAPAKTGGPIQINTFFDSKELFKENPQTERVKPTSPIKPASAPPSAAPGRTQQTAQEKPSGSIAGFQGDSPEKINERGQGEGIPPPVGKNNAAPSEIPRAGSDIYRVGVEDPPEAIGGIKGIIARIPSTTPELSASSGRQVYITAFIDESGAVRKAVISKGLGNALDGAIASAVTRTRFTPGKDKGTAVKVQMLISITLP